jgi:hypothetical protein
MKIEQIEKQCKDAGLSALYLTTMKAVYAMACLRNKENGNKRSDLDCVQESFDRIERAWALEERMPVSRASVDILLVQILKDEIAISQVAKIVQG